MWTTEQANRVALGFDLFVCVALLALAGRWLVNHQVLFALIALGFALAMPVLRYRRRQRHQQSPSLVAAHANDEREAFAQLRAWAIVGQALMACLLVLVVVNAVSNTLSPYVWLFAVAAMIGNFSMRWLHARS